MVVFPSVGDFWHCRCTRLVEQLPENHLICELNDYLWTSCKEETHHILIPSGNGEDIRIGILSIQQGPTRKHAFYDWQHLPDTYRHVQRMRAVHGNLRCALAESESDKIVGTVGINLQELKLSQVESLCEEMADWWELSEGIFLSPFSQMSYVMRNWTEGVYGDRPAGLHPSLDPIREIDADPRLLAYETAVSIYSILKKQFNLGASPEVGVVGIGAWAESVVSEVRSLGAACSHFDYMPVGRRCDILFLLHTENSVTTDIAEQLNCGALVELLPGQINPDSDDILRRKEVVVVPDVFCMCSQEIVENWWLGGRRVPGWEMALYVRLSEVWEGVLNKSKREDLSYHDATLILALEMLSRRWEL